MYRMLCSPPSVWKTIQKLASSWGEVGKGEKHGKLKRRPPWWQLIWQLYSRDDLARFPDSLALPTVGWGFGYSWWIASASLFLSMSLCLYLSLSMCLYLYLFSATFGTRHQSRPSLATLTTGLRIWFWCSLSWEELMRKIWRESEVWVECWKWNCTKVGKNESERAFLQIWEKMIKTKI